MNHIVFVAASENDKRKVLKPIYHSRWWLNFLTASDEMGGGPAGSAWWTATGGSTWTGVVVLLLPLPSLAKELVLHSSLPTLLPAGPLCGGSLDRQDMVDWLPRARKTLLSSDAVFTEIMLFHRSLVSKLFWKKEEKGGVRHFSPYFLFKVMMQQ